MAPFTADHLSKLDLISSERKQHERFIPRKSRAGQGRDPIIWEAPVLRKLSKMETHLSFSFTPFRPWDYTEGASWRRSLHKLKEGLTQRKGSQLSFTHSEITEEGQEPQTTNIKRIWSLVSPVLVSSSTTLFPSSAPVGFNRNSETEEGL